MTQDRPDMQERNTTPIDTRAAAQEADEFWSRSFSDREYTQPDRDYDYYRDAYRLGHTWARSHGGGYGDAEAALRSEWEAGESEMAWEEARPAVRDAFERASNTDHSTPGNPLS